MRRMIDPRSRPFRREWLPSVDAYYAAQGLQLRGRAAWRYALCPFHDDTRPSLRIQPASGAFCCMACGARGGDVVSFHMKRYRLGFVDAAKALGAWEGR